jgi:hypothetical protein
MKIREIIGESISAEEQLGQKSIASSMLPVLMQLQKRFEDREIKNPSMRMDAVIKAIRNTGDICTVQDLHDAWENDPAIKNILANMNNDFVVFKSVFDEPDFDETGEEQSPENGEQVVDQMAKSAMGDGL